MSPSPPTSQVSEPAAAQQTASSAKEAPPSKSVAILFVVAGLLAGGAGTVVIKQTRDHYKVPQELQNVSREDDAGTAKLVAAEKQVDGQNLMLAVTLIGAVVGGVLGGTSGVAARSVSRGAMGLALGLILGAGLGLASARFGPTTIGERIDGWVPRTATHESRQNWQMSRMIALHGAIWGTIGLAAALAVSLPTADVRTITKTAIGALAVGAVSMMLFHVLMAGAFGLSRFNALLPEGTGPVLAWTLLPAALLGLLVGSISIPRPEAQP